MAAQDGNSDKSDLQPPTRQIEGSFGQVESTRIEASMEQPGESTEIELGTCEAGKDESHHKAGQQQEKRPTSGFEISWHNLSYTVEPEWYEFGSRARVQILNNLSGSFRSGELSAVLGPSGAGKSTLISCLLGKKSKGVSGRTKLTYADADEERTRRSLKIAIIPQQDHLLQHLTVTEALMYASRFKNLTSDHGIGRQSGAKVEEPFDHRANVAWVIKQLRLQSCAQVSCGRISGGQYKRVSIGLELLSRPDLLILDEPTSGLDALTSLKTVDTLRQLVDSSGYPMAIVSIVHQPDVELFNLFHRTYVLASGGRAIYEGPTGEIFQAVRGAIDLIKSNATQQQQQLQQKVSAKEEEEESKVTTDSETSTFRSLAKLEAQLSDPSGCLIINPARLIVEVAAGEYGPELTDAMRIREPRMLATDAAVAMEGANHENGISLLTLNEVSLQQDSQSADHIYAEEGCGRQKRAQLDKKLSAKNTTNYRGSVRGYLDHVVQHTTRSWKCLVRDPILFWFTLLLHVSLPFMICFTFMNHKNLDACPILGPVDFVDEAYRGKSLQLTRELRAVGENYGFIFTLVFVILFASMCATALTYPLVVNVLLREYRNGWYSLSSYFLGKSLADIPLTTLNVFITIFVAYHLSGQPPSPYMWRFAGVALLTILLAHVAQTQGLFFGAMFMEDPQSAIVASAASLAPVCAVSGYLLRVEDLPQPLGLLSKLSFLTHYMNGFTIFRYGFNICPCDEGRFKINPAHEIAPGIRRFFSNWIHEFAEEYAHEPISNSSLTAFAQNTTTNGTTRQQVDFIKVMSKTMADMRTFGHEIKTCDDVKTFAMLDYNLEDSDIWFCFLSMVALWMATKFLAFMTLKWKIDKRV